MRKIAFVFCLFLSFHLHAEIEKIVMKWNALDCLDVCTPLFEDQLEKIPNIIDLEINSRAGTAVMGWKPNYPFSYEPFNLASRTVGIRLSDFRLQVRGTISQQEDNFYIISSGDNSSFLLLGPLAAQSDQYTIKWNIASHPITPALKLRLQEAADSKQITEIEGPLFEPARFLLMLVVEQIKFPKDE